MDAIIKSAGETDSERYLARLSEQTFLDLWSYPSPFRSKKQNGTGDGKEICDLLVVCGSDHILFSDKCLAFGNREINLSWARWFRAGIEEPARKLLGAAKILTSRGEKIFLDKGCTREIPIEFNQAEGARVRLVLVASASPVGEVRPDFRLKIVPGLKNSGHTCVENPFYDPMSIGDVISGGIFCHVFDRTGIESVLKEFDTMVDFLAYLDLRERAIRTESFESAESEMALLASLWREIFSYETDGYFPSLLDASTSCRGKLVDSSYKALALSTDYLLKAQADKPAQYWDGIIRHFTRNVVSGSDVGFSDQPPTHKLAESALRVMAKANRRTRRELGVAFYGFRKLIEGGNAERRVRAHIPLLDENIRTLHGAFAGSGEIGYLFLALDFANGKRDGVEYAEHRNFRQNLLKAYCYVLLCQHRGLSQVVGIAVDGETDPLVLERSEDLVLVAAPAWTEEAVAAAAEYQKSLDIRLGSSPTTGLTRQPFGLPVRNEVKTMTRQQRRAIERAVEKSKRPRRPS